MCLIIIQSPLFQISMGECLGVDDSAAHHKGILLFDPFQIRKLTDADLAWLLAEEKAA